MTPEMKTKKYLTLLISAVALLSIQCNAGEGKSSTRQDKKPNVLFIAIDDLNDWTGILKGNPPSPDTSHGEAGFHGNTFYECALRGSGLRSFKVCNHERDPSFHIG